MSHYAFIMSVVLAGGDDGPFQSPAAGDSYAFTIEEAGRGVKGRYAKGMPVWVQADMIEFFRQGEVLVYKQDGSWQRTRTGTLSDPLRILGASAKVRAVRLPHEELAALAKSWLRLKKVEAKDQIILSGELDEKGAKELARTENRGVAQSGSARLWLGPKGDVLKYTLTLRLQGRIGGAEIDGSTSKTVLISGIGATAVDLPPQARKALD